MRRLLLLMLAVQACREGRVVGVTCDGGVCPTTCVEGAVLGEDGVCHLTLSSLEVDAEAIYYQFTQRVPLQPAFSPAIRSYEVVVPSHVTSVELRPRTDAYGVFIGLADGMPLGASGDPLVFRVTLNRVETRVKLLVFWADTLPPEREGYELLIRRPGNENGAPRCDYAPEDECSLPRDAGLGRSKLNVTQPGFALLSANGCTTAVGWSWRRDVELYRRTASGWTFEHLLLSPAYTPQWAFLNGAGNMAFILQEGAPCRADQPFGVRVFHRSRCGWKQTACLTPFGLDQTAMRLGSALSGSRLAVASADDAGASLVWLEEQPDAGWRTLGRRNLACLSPNFLDSLSLSDELEAILDPCDADEVFLLDGGVLPSPVPVRATVTLLGDGTRAQAVEWSSTAPDGTDHYLVSSFALALDGGWDRTDFVLVPGFPAVRRGGIFAAQNGSFWTRGDAGWSARRISPVPLIDSSDDGRTFLQLVSNPEASFPNFSIDVLEPGP